jgi:hypothetical protein
MKRIHRDVGAICSLITDNGLVTLKARSDGNRQSEVMPASAVRELLDRSNQLWGRSLDYFLAIQENENFSARGLSEAVVSVEAPGTVGFLLVAYQDGGVISISSRTYPFQQDAPSAAWWHP